MSDDDLRTFKEVQASSNSTDTKKIVTIKVAKESFLSKNVGSASRESVTRSATQRTLTFLFFFRHLQGRPEGHLAPALAEERVVRGPERDGDVLVRGAGADAGRVQGHRAQEVPGREQHRHGRMEDDLQDARYVGILSLARVVF